MRLFLFATVACALFADGPGAKAEYVGGTLDIFAERASGRMVTSHAEELRFSAHARTVSVPYVRIHTLEYGQKVDRRYVSALLISPMFLLAKSRKHFLTIGYDDDAGRAQALVFRVDKNGIRALLSSLEARTGRKIVYQDNEARKAGKG